MKHAFTIILGFLLFTSTMAVADDGPPTSGTAALLCKMSRHAQLTTETLSIDYEQKLVNGYTATFTPSTIAWTIKDGDKTQHHELNRITGTYSYWTDSEPPGEPLPTFSCEKAPAKF